MPKYTHHNLENYLKIDSKKIKKSNKNLKNSDILNFLSQTIGYKNYHEVSKRLNNKMILELSNLNDADLELFIKDYQEKVISFFKLTEFNSSFNFTIRKRILKVKRYNDLNKSFFNNSYYDMTSNDIAFELDDEYYRFIIFEYIENSYKNIKKLNLELYSLFSFINQIHSNNVSKEISLQKKISHYLNADFLIEQSKIIYDGSDEINRLIDDLYNLNILISILKRLSKHSFIDLSSKNITIINSEYLINKKTNFNIVYNDYIFNRKMLEILFNMGNRVGYKEKEIPIEYHNALLGFKEQAYASLNLFDDRITTVKSKLKLKNAHNLLSNSPIQTKHIYKLLMDKVINIETVDNDILFDKLSEHHPYYLSHLRYDPIYYVASKKINNKSYYYITTYFSDVDLCGGSSTSYQDTIDMLINSEENLLILNDIKEIKLNLKEPYFASFFHFKI